LRFAKLQGTGNDFLLANPADEAQDWAAISKAMCERHFGAGADGLMLVLPSDKADVRMRLFNADGSEAEVSGNGVRCLVKYAIEGGIAKATNDQLTVEVAHEVLRADVTMSGDEVSAVRLSMGKPIFEPKEIPVLAEVEPPVLDFPIDANGEMLIVNCVSMGNPHAVLFVSQPVEDYPLERLGPVVEYHSAFPQRVNFGVARIEARDRMHVRVWERGVGETLACGTGSCAAMVAARLHDLAGERVEIVQPGGNLIVEWDGNGEVFLSGPAEFIFEGDWPGV
jgi:diaminopimelate epimerase